MEDDSVKLLRECNAGIKMGISSIDDVMDHGRKPGLRHCQLDYRWLQHGNQIPVPLLKPVSGSG